jgi:hypothetical protein
MREGRRVEPAGGRKGRAIARATLTWPHSACAEPFAAEKRSMRARSGASSACCDGVPPRRCDSACSRAMLCGIRVCFRATTALHDSPAQPDEAKPGLRPRRTWRMFAQPCE